jgi:hypothetical protein
MNFKLLLFFTLVVFSCSNKKENSPKKKNTQNTQIDFATIPNLPESMTFAGEKILLQDELSISLNPDSYSEGKAFACF